MLKIVLLLILLLMGATTEYWGYDESKTLAGKIFSFCMAVFGVAVLCCLINS